MDTGKRKEQITNLSLSDLKVITSSLSQVISPLYGPKSQQALVITDTGHVSMSFDGVTVLSKLHLSHPIAKTIFDSIATFSTVYGDSTKCLIIYINGLIRALEVYHHKQGELKEVYYRSQVANLLTKFISFDLDYVLSDFYNKSTEIHLLPDHKCRFHLIKDVIYSCMNSSLSSMDSAYFSDIGSLFITDLQRTEREFQQDIHFNLINFEELVFRISGISHESFISDGFHSPGRLSYFSTSKHGKLICFQSVFDNSDEDGQKYEYHSISGNIQSLISHRLTKVKQFVSALSEAKISFVISADKVAKYVLSIFSSYKISVVELEDLSSFQFFTTIAGISPVSSLTTDFPPKNVVDVEFLEEVSYGSRNFIKIIISNLRSDLRLKTLFLSSPTDSGSSQLKYTYKKALKSVMHCMCDLENKHLKYEEEELKDDSASLKKSNQKSPASLHTINHKGIISCCGQFELLLQQCLGDYSFKKSHNITFCCNLVCEMLSGALQVLNKNLLNQRKIGKQELHLKLFQKGNILMSSPRYEGQIVDVIKIKVAAVTCALQLAIRLLRVESIVHVRKLKEKSESSEDEL